MRLSVHYLAFVTLVVTTGTRGQNWNITECMRITEREFLYPVDDYADDTTKCFILDMCKDNESLVITVVDPCTGAHHVHDDVSIYQYDGISSTPNYLVATVSGECTDSFAQTLDYDLGVFAGLIWFEVGVNRSSFEVAFQCNEIHIFTEIMDASKAMSVITRRMQIQAQAFVLNNNNIPLFRAVMENYQLIAFIMVRMQTEAQEFAESLSQHNLKRQLMVLWNTLNAALPIMEVQEAM